MDILSGKYGLVSFAERRQLKVIDMDHTMAGIMLDSGAFTMWRQGTEVDLWAYIDFCLSRGHRLDGYFVLDRIPGTYGQAPTPDGCERAIEETLANLATMEAFGLRPIPVYHEGEPVELLDWYVARGHALIGLGATASRRNTDAKARWVLGVIARHPEQRFHGLGMASDRLVGLPLFSADAMTWQSIVINGTKGSATMIERSSRLCRLMMGILAIEDATTRPTQMALFGTN